jgi:hypothetical protein
MLRGGYANPMRGKAAKTNDRRVLSNRFAFLLIGSDIDQTFLKFVGHLLPLTPKKPIRVGALNVSERAVIHLANSRDFRVSCFVQSTR